MLTILGEVLQYVSGALWGSWGGVDRGPVLSDFPFGHFPNKRIRKGNLPL